MKVNFKNIILLVVIVAVMLIAVSLFNDFTKDQDEMILTDLHALIDNGLVTELKIDEENLVTGKKYVIEGTDPDTGSPVYKLNADGTRATVDFEFQLAYAYQAKAIEDKNPSAEGNALVSCISSLYHHYPRLYRTLDIRSSLVA